jgi:dTDP-4-amino-4,6-dideoxygalactose transaminase
MLKCGVSTRRGIMCAHREPAYEEQPQRHSLVHSEQAQDECILVPLFSQMTDTDIARVCEALRQSL